MGKPETETEYRIALAGNPNVGKSTVFNALTGLHQHTGNWAGKTVVNARGQCSYQDRQFILTDLPGMYSLRVSSPEEAEARSYLLSGEADAVIVVCDACCLERNLHLVLQMMELVPRVLVCVNLMDEAKKRGIYPDADKLAQALGTPVVTVTARDGTGLDALLAQLTALLEAPVPAPLQVGYGETADAHLQILSDCISDVTGYIPARWAALRLLEDDAFFAPQMEAQLSGAQQEKLLALRFSMEQEGLAADAFCDHVITTLVKKAARIAAYAVQNGHSGYSVRDRRLDRIFLSRRWGIPIMLLLLAGILWLTMQGANYPSEALSSLLFSLGDGASALLQKWGAPAWVDGLFIQGMYRVLAWVVSVMLPPMAIFFPLFTLLEDAGYLPRVAFHMDRGFRCAGTCGKQALTMCMGLGCNAAGVTGCRIIDSPRERMIAMLTNCFVPCNGRFPLLLALIAMFFCTGTGMVSSLFSTVMLLGMLLCGIGMTFLISWVLGKTLLRGMPSSFILELPPYRRPRIGQVIVRSILDRTIFVLGRACAVAAPAGMLIWILANFHIGGASILAHCADFLDPAAQLMGLDGIILIAFILGFPANEIVIPIMIMLYLANGSLTDITELSTLQGVFVENGWTWLTALCTMLFSLFHFPCSTTCLTLLKETGSKRWTLLGMLLPTVCGVVVCMLVHAVCSLFV